MYLVLLLVSVLSYGCRACVLTGHPDDTVAEIGENATLTCSADFNNCRDDTCVFHWQRETNNAFQAISMCVYVYPRYPDRYSMSSGPDWSLTITGVQSSDVGRYRCKVYSRKSQSSKNSLIATLIIPSLIDISVQPPRRPITTGDNATFHCTVQSNRGALPTLNVKWFVNGTHIRRFQDQSMYHLNNDGYTLTFFNIQVNHTNVYCEAFSGTKYVKRSDNYLILIHPQKKPITSTTQVPETEESPTVNPAEFPHDTDEPSTTQVPETEESLTVNPAEFPHDTDEPSTTQEPETEESHPNPDSTYSLNMVSSHSITPTYRNIPSVTVEGAHQSTPNNSSPKNHDPKIQDTSLDVNITVILVGWSLAAVFICLFISLLLYIVVIKRRSKANHNSTRVVQTTQDEDAEAYEEMETQLHGQAASIGHKETAPSSYQELIFK